MADGNWARSIEHIVNPLDRVIFCLPFGTISNVGRVTDSWHRMILVLSKIGPLYQLRSGVRGPGSARRWSTSDSIAKRTAVGSCSSWNPGIRSTR